MVERKEAEEKQPEKESVLEVREGAKEALAMNEAEVVKNFDESEFGQYHLACYGVESFIEIVILQFV